MPRSVSLEEVLACQTDPLIVSLFSLRGDDVQKLMLGSKEFDATSAASHGYVAEWDKINKQFVIVAPKHRESFCSDSPTMKGFIVGTDGMMKYPLMVDIFAEDRWSLEPNEVFAHADQFKFESGTFDNSTNVYLTATRGKTSIQFIFQKKNLRLYRVSYENPQHTKE